MIDQWDLKKVARGTWKLILMISRFLAETLRTVFGPCIQGEEPANNVAYFVAYFVV